MPAFAAIRASCATRRSRWSISSSSTSSAAGTTSRCRSAPRSRGRSRGRGLRRLQRRRASAARGGRHGAAARSRHGHARPLLGAPDAEHDLPGRRGRHHQCPSPRDPRADRAARGRATCARRASPTESLWRRSSSSTSSTRCLPNDINTAYYRIDSRRGRLEQRRRAPRQNLGDKIPRKGGYHAMPPLDQLYNLRAEMVARSRRPGIPVRYHHHEVGGPGQWEIEIDALPLRRAADVTMLVKYIIKNVRLRERQQRDLHAQAALQRGGQRHALPPAPGQGRRRTSSTTEGGYAGLSQLALQYIGGLLRHGRALLALTNPSTNSYKRLVPGFEAPVLLFYGLANRSAAVRIPKYVDTPTSKRIEFRPARRHLQPLPGHGRAAHGRHRRHPPAASTRAAGLRARSTSDIETLPPRSASASPLPTSLREALLALEEDHAFLTAGGVFPRGFVRGLDRHEDRSGSTTRCATGRTPTR